MHHRDYTEGHTDEDVVMSGFEDTVSYSEQITQNVTFQWGEIALVRDTDYTVTCRPAEWQESTKWRLPEPATIQEPLQSSLL